MAPTVRSAGQGNSGTGTATSFSPVMPVGFVAGDLLVGIACGSNGTAPSTRPSGSTSIRATADGTVFHMDAVYKVAVGSDVFTWTIGTARKWAGAVIAITTGTYATGSQATIMTESGVAHTAVAGTAYTTPSITPAGADTLLIAVFGNQAASTWTNANTTPTMVEIADTTSTGTTPASCAVYRSSAAPAASAITRLGTATVSSANAAMWIVSINPLVAASLPSVVVPLRR